jgi:hypothetical protein
MDMAEVVSMTAMVELGGLGQRTSGSWEMGQSGGKKRHAWGKLAFDIALSELCCHYEGIRIQYKLDCTYKRNELGKQQKRRSGKTKATYPKLRAAHFGELHL